MAVSYDLNLRDYWYVLRKRRAVVIAVTLLVVAFSLGFSYLSRKAVNYRATASVKIEKAITPTGLFIEALSYSGGDPVATQAVVIKSYPVMALVAKKLDLVGPDLSAEEIQRNPRLLETVISLAGRIDTQREPSTDIIHITATAGDPTFTQRLANATAEAFREYSLFETNKRVLEAKKFIEAQLASVQERLKGAEEELRAFRQTHEIVATDAQVSSFSNQIAAAERDLAAVKDERRALADLLADLKEKNLSSLLTKSDGFQRLAQDLPSSLAGENFGPALGKLRDQLADLTREREVLLLDLTPQHPRVEAINNRINEVLSTLVRDVSIRAAALATREAVLQDTLGQTKKKIGDAPEVHLTLARLEREVNANEKIYTELASKYQEVLIKNAEQIEEVSVIQPALAPGAPIETSSSSAVVPLALLMGVVSGSVLAFVIETVDTSFGAIEDIESFLNMPVLGVITHIDAALIEKSFDDENGMPASGTGAHQRHVPERLLLLLAPTAFPSENFRALRTNLDFSCLEKGAKTLLLTSSSDGEGKSTIATNAAIAFAQAGKRTLLIDGDLRKPDIHKIFGLEHSPGLSDVILGNISWQEAVRTITDLVVGKYSFERFLFAPGMDQLHIMVAGTPVSHPVELLDSRRAEEFFAEVREHYDVVLVDSPPVLAVADTVILGSKLDGVVVVYEFGRVGRRALQHVKTQLENVQAHLYGVVINNLQAEVSPDFHDVRYYRAKYGYKYEAYPQQRSKTRPAGGPQWAARFWQFFS